MTSFFPLLPPSGLGPPPLHQRQVPSASHFLTTPRGQWIAAQILASFRAEGVSEQHVATLFTGSSGERFSALLGAGQDDRRVRLFVFHQPRDGQPNPVLFTGYGDNQEQKLKRKALYFLRAGNGSNLSVPIDLSKACDDTLLCGELSPDILLSLQSTVNDLFNPSIKAREDFGRADRETVDDLRGSLSSFSASLDEAVEGIEHHVVHLRRPDPSKADLETVSRELFASPSVSGGAARRSAFRASEVARHLEEILEDWIVTIEEVIHSMGSGSNGSAEGSPTTARALGLDISLAPQRAVSLEELEAAVPHSKGPLGIIHYWHERTQRLASIIEQLKTRECRLVISVVTALLSRDAPGQQVAPAGAGVGRLPPVPAPPTPLASSSTAPSVNPAPLPTGASASFRVLRRWKSTDIALTQAYNEAKDNLKYLSSLTQFLMPLDYKHWSTAAEEQRERGGSSSDKASYPRQTMESLPALLSAVKMLGTISRYFGTSRERMTDLMVKTTHCLVGSCGRYLLSLEPPATSTISAASLSDPRTFVWAAAAPMPPSSGSASSPLAAVLLRRMEEVLRLQQSYVENYHLVMTAPAASGNPMTLNEDLIFRPMDALCRRVVKLIDVVSISTQLNTFVAEEESLDVGNVRPIIADFRNVVGGLKAKKHDLLHYQDSAFDRDYVAFSVTIGELEASFQRYIDTAFAATPSIDGALALFTKFDRLLHRQSLREGLESRMLFVFDKFAGELERVEKEYEKDKAHPPATRDVPAVAGAILWSQHLRKRVEGPMQIFQRDHPSLLHTKEARRIVRRFNQVHRVLLAFESLWLNAWSDSVEAVKEAMQATLLVRHPADGNLYVNLDLELLQCIKEARFLDRMAVGAIPEGAKVLLLQEQRLKRYAVDLQRAIDEVRRLHSRIVPVTAALLRPALRDLEFRMRPGLTTLTWASVSVEPFLQSLFAGLQGVDGLISNSNDILKNRIERKLKEVSRAMLLSLPTPGSGAPGVAHNRKALAHASTASGIYSLDEFVSLQQEYVAAISGRLQAKSEEVESAVEDLISACASSSSTLAHRSIEAVSKAEADDVRSHYQRFFLAALLSATKASLHALRARLTSAGSEPTMAAPVVGSAPLFEIAVRLQAPRVSRSSSSSAASFVGLPPSFPPMGLYMTSRMSSSRSSVQGYAPHQHPGQLVIDSSAVSLLLEDEKDDDEAAEHFRHPLSEVKLKPSLDDVQQTVNECCKTVLGASKGVYRWSTIDGGIKPREDGREHTQRESLFKALTSDMEIARVVLLLAGSVQSLRKRAEAYTQHFEDEYSWLWREDPVEHYRQSPPTVLDDWRDALHRFSDVGDAIESDIQENYSLGALSLSTATLKSQLQALLVDWKRTFLGGLHAYAKNKMNETTEDIKGKLAALHRPVDDIAALDFAMKTLQAVREKEAVIEQDELTPIFEAYSLLEHYLSTLPSTATSGGSAAAPMVSAAGSGVAAVAALASGAASGSESSRSTSGGGASSMALNLTAIPTTELDEKALLRPLWSKVIEKANEVSGLITRTQHGFKRQLLTNVKDLRKEARQFRADYLQNGPMAAAEEGLASDATTESSVSDPHEAMDRLKRYSDVFELLERKRNLYNRGEAIFALPITPFPEVDETASELHLLSSLYDVYGELLEKREEEWSRVPWSEVPAFVESTMEPEVVNFQRRVHELPSQVKRDIPAFQDLQKLVNDYAAVVLPLLKALTRFSIKQRHWETITATFFPDDRSRAAAMLSPSTNKPSAGRGKQGGAGGSPKGGRGRASSLIFPVKPQAVSPALSAVVSPGATQVGGAPVPAFVIPALTDPGGYLLGHFLSLPVVEHADELRRTTELAEEQALVEARLKELSDRWLHTEELSFRFGTGASSNVPIIDNAEGLVTALGHSINEIRECMVLRPQAVEPFMAQAEALLATLESTLAILKMWLEVQQLWLPLETFFVSAPDHKDHSRHLPRISIRFTRLDRDYSRMMQNAQEKLVLVTKACGNELVKAALPHLLEEFGKCHVAVEEYLHPQDHPRAAGNGAADGQIGTARSARRP